MDVDLCLERIGYRGPTPANLQTLRALQMAFLLKVPFENLDIHLGREIELLNALGFQVEYLSARMVKGTAVGPEYDHMVLLVTLEHEYLVDVGNGQSCREPLRIDGTNRGISEGYTYRVGPHGNDLALYYQQSDAEWKPRFLFTLTPRERLEFLDMCHFHQRSADSIFTQHRLATIAKVEGRVSLTDMRLEIAAGLDKQERELGSEKEYFAILKHYFGIEITD